MSRIHVFADEAGNLDFRRVPGASRYFILTTVTAIDCAAGDALLALRRELAWEGVDQPGPFHATEDVQAVRDRVYSTLDGFPFRIDSTIIEKSKTRSHLRNDVDRFHKTAWYLHMRTIAAQIATERDEILLVASAFGTRRQRSQFVQALRDVVDHVAPETAYRIAFWPAGTDPGLEVADYCCWAIQRKWEREDRRSYELVRAKIAHEGEAFRSSRAHHY